MSDRSAKARPTPNRSPQRAAEAAPTLFQMTDYRKFLTSRLGPSGTRNGVRTKLARALGCHGSFLSLILGGAHDLSLEQAQRAADHFRLDGEETEYFLTLVEISRAGTARLRRRFETRREALRAKRSLVQNRVVRSRDLSEADRARFYSSWMYGAIHVLVSVPEYRNPGALARALGVSREVSDRACRFVESVGLIERVAGIYRIRTGSEHVHLSGDHPLARTHHANWRLKGLARLDEASTSDLRYSLAFTAAHADVEWFREKILELVEAATERIGPSPAEEAHVFNLDLFRLTSDAN